MDIGVSFLNGAYHSLLSFWWKILALLGIWHGVLYTADFFFCNAVLESSLIAAGIVV